MPWWIVKILFICFGLLIVIIHVFFWSPEAKAPLRKNGWLDYSAQGQTHDKNGFVMAPLDPSDKGPGRSRPRRD